MSRINKSLALVFALLFVLTALVGCKSGNDDPTPTVQPTSGNDATSDATPTPTEEGDPTQIPEWMWTPDPALYILGENGYYEDDILSANWPAYLEYKDSVYQNCARYIGYPEGSEKKLVFSYTVDQGGSYADEIAGYDFDGYQEYITNYLNEYFYLEEYSKIKIDGHDAIKAVYNYNPPGEPEHYTRVLQYSIDVNGWILGLGFTTQLETFPEECITCINTIKFKEGY